MPIQLARATQLESYEQTFYFSAADEIPNLSAVDDLDTQLRVSTQIDDNFRELIGDENWQIVKDKYGFGPLRDELLSQELKLKGVLTSLLSVDAYDQDSFYFEGNGRFFLVRETNSEILLAGDFLIIPISRPIRSLDAGYVDVDVMLFISRIPNEITRFNDSKVRYRIKVDTSRSRSQVYVLDYDASHSVFLLRTSPDGDEQAKLIGHMRFDKRMGESKLLDLRGRQFLRNDYATLPRTDGGAN